MHGQIVSEVKVGGAVSDNKGVNVPDVLVPIPALTDKDRDDLQFALEQRADWIALSFVQRPEDVAEARSLIGDRAALLAKIEKPAAIDRLNDIIALADAVMVARGDLGVELPPEQVPPLQNKIVACARQFGKPVVVATQMLESMVTSPTPTRAEVSDVATAIYDGADAVMLSAESAAGQYPCEAVQMMDRIANSVERDPSYQARVHFTQTRLEPTTADALAGSARQIASTVSATAMLCYTSSGSTARRIARERPPVPLLAMSASLHTVSPAGPAVGRARSPHARRLELRGDGREGEANGAAPPDRQGRRPGDRHGRHSVRHGGLDQRAARRPADRRRAGATPGERRLSAAVTRGFRRRSRGRGSRSARLSSASAAPASPCSQTAQSKALSGSAPRASSPPTMPASTSPLPETPRPGAPPS